MVEGWSCLASSLNASERCAIRAVNPAKSANDVATLCVSIKRSGGRRSEREGEEREEGSNEEEESDCFSY